MSAGAFAPADTAIDCHSPELAALVAADALPRGRALDLGSGNGTEAIFLARRGWHVVALDIDASARREARRLVSERLRGRQRARVHTPKPGNVLSFRERRPGTFDLAYDRLCFYNFETYAHRKRLLNTVAYSLREGGLFVLRLRTRDEFGTPRRDRKPQSQALPGRSRRHATQYFRFSLHDEVSYAAAAHHLIIDDEVEGLRVAGFIGLSILCLWRNGERFVG